VVAAAAGTRLRSAGDDVDEGVAVDDVDTASTGRRRRRSEVASRRCSASAADDRSSDCVR